MKIIFFSGFLVFFVKIMAYVINFADMRKSDIIRDLTLATKQRKFAADFADLYGYPFSVVEDFAENDSDVNDLLTDYKNMLKYLEEKAYFEGVEKGRYPAILEKRLIKSGFIDISKFEFRGSLPPETIENIKSFLGDNSEV